MENCQKHFIVKASSFFYLFFFFFKWQRFYAIICKVWVKCKLPSDTASLLYLLNFKYMNGHVEMLSTCFCCVHISVSNFFSIHFNQKLQYQKLLIYIFSHLSTVFSAKLQSSILNNTECLCTLILQVIYILRWCAQAEVHWFWLHYAHTDCSDSSRKYTEAISPGQMTLCKKE